MSTASCLPTLGHEQLVAVTLAQLDSMANVIEHHGIELGMLLDGLMGLIERHREETRQHALVPPVGGGAGAGDVASQLARDHETMLAFVEPFVVARQFHDRFRQRLEHLRAALATLPHASRFDPEQHEELCRLFPFEEERSVSAALCGIELEAAHGPELELF